MISKSYADGMILFAWVKAERKYYWNGTMSESRHNLFFKSIDSNLGKYYIASINAGKTNRSKGIHIGNNNSNGEQKKGEYNCFLYMHEFKFKVNSCFFLSTIRRKKSREVK